MNVTTKPTAGALRSMYYPHTGETQILYTAHNLPAPESFGRWVPSRIELFVLAVKNGLIEKEDFLTRYGVTAKEFRLWTQQVEKAGRPGVRANQRVYVREAPTINGLRNGGIPTFLSVGDSVVNVVRRQATKKGVPVHLTPRQWEILSLLVENKGAVTTRETIFDHLYQAGTEPEPKIIDVMICRIRQVLGISRDTLETVWGRGYRLILPAS